MHTVWGCKDPAGWWDEKGMSKRVHRTDDPDVGYLRGEWRRVGEVADSPAMVEGGVRAVKWYKDIEELRRDKAVYRAVRATIGAAHVGDGVTVWDIMGETEEQRRQGRIGYMVVAERKGHRGEEGLVGGQRRLRGGGGRRTGRSTDVHRRREGEERGGEAEDEGGESGTVPAGIPRDEEATPPRC